MSDETTGLVDAGNWSVTDTWETPSDAVTGVYIAKLTRLDGTPGQNVIPFVVRDDASTSDITFQTADSTWQAYNAWGQTSLYTDPAPAVSYNRPIETPLGPDENTSAGAWDFIFGAEYSAIRFLEKNGFDVSYMASIDADRFGSLIQNHKVYMNAGHDEYWTGNQRANVEAARDAGVHLAFMGGNEVYWKTELLPSIDGTETPYRTLVCYKTTSTGTSNPDGVWTGLWRDIEAGTTPENALTGTIYMVDWDHNDPIHNITVPYADSQLRFWKNTTVATLQPGETYTSAGQYLGYEWDIDWDNGYRPAGLIDLSHTTIDTPIERDETEGLVSGPRSNFETNSQTLYRAASGALVFGAGTVFWPWALDDHHLPGPDGHGADAPADPNIQQAMINLLADMGIQPATLDSRLLLAFASSDHTAPTAGLVSTTSSAGYSLLQGVASDLGGGVVAGVEVSIDNGASWHPAQGTTSWSYDWAPVSSGEYSNLYRAVDDSLNLSPTFSGQVTVTATPSLINFSWSQGWLSPDNVRELRDINNDGRAEYIGFGTEYTFIAYHGTWVDDLGSVQTMYGGFSAVIADFRYESRLHEGPAAGSRRNRVWRSRVHVWTDRCGCPLVWRDECTRIC